MSRNFTFSERNKEDIQLPFHTIELQADNNQQIFHAQLFLAFQGLSKQLIHKKILLLYEFLILLL